MKFQHHPRLAIQDRQAGYLSGRSHPGVLGLHPGTELKRRVGQGFGRLLCPAGELVHQRRFTDENGKQHSSGYHYNFPVWEVLNEVEFEHKTTPEQYTARYDAIVSAIHEVSPDTKIHGACLSGSLSRSSLF